MEEIRKALQELADDAGVPQVTQEDVAAFDTAVDRRTDRAALAGIGPKTLCLIKCAIQFGICKAGGGTSCATEFAKCVAACYGG